MPTRCTPEQSTATVSLAVDQGGHPRSAPPSRQPSPPRLSRIYRHGSSATPYSQRTPRAPHVNNDSGPPYSRIIDAHSVWPPASTSSHFPHTAVRERERDASAPPPSPATRPPPATSGSSFAHPAALALTAAALANLPTAQARRAASVLTTRPFHQHRKESQASYQLTASASFIDFSFR